MDDVFDCNSDGFPCRHCELHVLELGEHGENASNLYYHKDTYPVMFNCQFIYCYDEDPLIYATKLRKGVSKTLAKHFKQLVPVYADVRAHKYDGALEAQDCDYPTMTTSLLVDFPFYVDIYNSLDLWKAMFEDRTPDLKDWTMNEFAENDHLSLARLKWFMARAGVVHYEVDVHPCKRHYTQARMCGIPPSTLSYNPNTYPIVFKTFYEFPSSTGTGADTNTYAEAEEHGRYLVRTTKARLRERFRRDVSVFANFEMRHLQSARKDDDSILVSVSLLIDFRCLEPGDSAKITMAFLNRKTIMRLMREVKTGVDNWSCPVEIDGRMRDLSSGIGVGVGVGVLDWEAYISSSQGDLCRARLGWFLEREGGGFF
ncbi:hypothetical protein BDV19DRAFT_387592 [Aspergillus venezuelensis]